ncbi:MAG: flippase-like domain-containing protein [Acidimicrobiales bacterium]
MAKTSQRNLVIRRVAAVVVTGLTFYIVFPALLRVISAWPHLSSLAPAWLVVMVVTEIVSFFCSLALQRMVLRIKGWFAIITAALTGNAVTNVLPGGDAVGASVQFQMLVTSGVDSVQAAGGLATSSLLGIAGLFSLPIFVLPAIVGGLSVNSGLLFAGLLGIGGFILIVATGAMVLQFDGILHRVGAIVQWVLNKVHRKKTPSEDLAARLIAERDLVRKDLGRNWRMAVLLVAGRIGLDYICLLAALFATGARPNPSLVLLAYAATAVVALIPLTPGGLGIVEASLSGLLILAGVKPDSAVLATLAYRLASYWLPIMAGTVSYFMFRRRYGRTKVSLTDP